LPVGIAKTNFEKSTLPINQPKGGIIISLTKESTIFPKAAPIMIPTAISITLPLMANVLNSSPHFFNFSNMFKSSLTILTTKRYAIILL
jgi:hypothetical protein